MAARMPVAAPVTSATRSRGVPVSLLGPFVCFFVRSVCLANAKQRNLHIQMEVAVHGEVISINAARVMAELGLCSTNQIGWDHRAAGR